MVWVLTYLFQHMDIHKFAISEIEVLRVGISDRPRCIWGQAKVSIHLTL